MAFTDKNIFPKAYGNEEETGLVIDYPYEGIFTEPYHFVQNHGKYIPSRFTSFGHFLSNGFKVYAGGAAEADSPTNLERATPECANPKQLVASIRASELLLEKMVSAYVEDTAYVTSRKVTAKSHRRVVDLAENRKACHDNFGLTPESYYKNIYNEQGSYSQGLKNVLEHLSTASIITGAGQVTERELRYAQKINGLRFVEHYGYIGSMIRIAALNSEYRFEARCGDINLSDWAAWQRIGGMALVLALNNTPLGNSLKTHNHYRDEDTIQLAKSTNRLRLTREGSILQSTEVLRAADFQQKISELVLDKLMFHTDFVPDEFYDLANERYHYIEDFKKVLDGSADISLLANRADWAAKFQAILQLHDKKAARGEHSQLSDLASQWVDMHYDIKQISSDGKPAKIEKLGIGYKLRNKHLFKNSIPDRKVTEAYTRPPQETRARVRGELIEHYALKFCDWHMVELYDPETQQSQMIDLDDVASAVLPDDVLLPNRTFNKKPSK